MAGTTVDAPALRINAARMGEAGDGADAVHLGRCMTDLRAAMVGSRAGLAAGLARTAWIDHLQALTEAAWTQRDALASSADAYSSTERRLRRELHLRHRSAHSLHDLHRLPPPRLAPPEPLSPVARS